MRLYNLIKELSDEHEITLVCEKRTNQSVQDIKEVEKICKKVITVERKKQWSVGNVLKAGTSQHSFLVTGHTHPLMQQKIQEELETNKFDLIHVETYYVMQNLPSYLTSFRRKSESRLDSSRITTAPGSRISPLSSKRAPSLRSVRQSGMTDQEIPIVLVEHNIEYKVYEKFLQRVPAFSRLLLSLDVAKIRKEEEMFWKQSSSLVAVSSDDKKVMEAAGFRPAIVSNGVNTDQFQFKKRSAYAKASTDKKEKKILFIGDFRWIQNKDSVSFIIKEIWPLIGEKRKEKKEKLDIKLWIVGRSIPESIRNLTSDPNVLFDTESSTKPTHEIFQEASVLLAPIRVGGGTSYKILESMSCGTPVVTMQLSADALEAKDVHEIMVGDDASTLADKTLQLLQDEAIYEKISKQGRTFVEKHYTWKEIAKKLDEVYRKVLV